MDTYSKYKDAFQYAGGGMKSQQMVGAAIDSAFEEQRKMQEEARKRNESKLRQGLYQVKISQALQDDMDDLNLTGITGAQGVDSVMNQAGRSMADYGAFLTSELKRTGNYDTYANEMSKLRSQVKHLGNIQNGVKLFSTNANKLLADGELSSFTSDDALMMAADFERGAPNGKFETVNGQLEWVSKTPPSEQHPEGKEYRIAASEFSRLNDKLLKKEDIDTIISGSMGVQKGNSGNILSFDQAATGEDGRPGLSAKDIALDSLDTVLAANGAEDEKILRQKRALMMDHFGATKEDTLKMAQTMLDPNTLSNEEKADGVRTELDRQVRNNWTDRAQGLYGINSDAVQRYDQAKGRYYLETQDQYANIADVKDIQRNLGNMTYKNQDGADVLSGSYQGRVVEKQGKDGTAIGNIMPLDQYKKEYRNEYSRELQNSLMKKGFHNPIPVMGKVSQATLDQIAAEKDETKKQKLIQEAIAIQSQPIGFRVTNHKLTDRQRPQEDVVVYLDDDLNTQWEKIGMANGLNPMEWLPRTKPNTNDLIESRQGPGVGLTEEEYFKDEEMKKGLERYKQKYPNLFKE